MPGRVDLNNRKLNPCECIGGGGIDKRKPADRGETLGSDKWNAIDRYQAGQEREARFLMSKENHMSGWMFYAVGAAILYGMHQIFTKMASDHISDGLGGFVVEGTAALTILVYLAWLKLGGKWNQTASAPGVWYSVLTGICVGVGTLLFFLLFQKGGPLSSVPMILAGGAAVMAIAGILFFKEPASMARLIGIVLAITGLFLLRIPAGK